MIAKNVAHQAVLGGSTARFITASQLLNDLAAQDSASALERRLRHYCRPALLAVDELGYLSTSADHADLLFELVTRRYQLEKPILLTTNKSFRDWNDVFPNSGVVVTLVDRLVHRCEVVEIEAESYRLKESEERKEKREKEREARSGRKKRKMS
jgi:DNA replication protein DnaC